MPLPEAKFVEVLGIRTRYFEAGSGAPLVLLHGGNFGGILSADCAANFDRNIEGLSSCARVIAVDRLGQGLTDNPVRLQDYTMTTVVAHVAGRDSRWPLARGLCRVSNHAGLPGSHPILHFDR
jgi:pimeloyl-ACP methyl ester carboxylesterase